MTKEQLHLITKRFGMKFDDINYVALCNNLESLEMRRRSEFVSMNKVLLSCGLRSIRHACSVIPTEHE